MLMGRPVPGRAIAGTNSRSQGDPKGGHRDCNRNKCGNEQTRTACRHVSPAQAPIAV